MSPGARLAAFGVALAATFGAGAALGTAVGPWEDGDAPAHHDADAPAGGTTGPGAHDDHGTDTTTTAPSGARDGD